MRSGWLFVFGVLTALESLLVLVASGAIGPLRLPPAGPAMASPPCGVNRHPVTEADLARNARRVVVERTFVDYDGRVLEEPLGDVVERADAIVAGTVVRQEYRIADCRRIVTLLTVKPRTVLKADPALKDLAELTVERLGGAARDGDAIVQEVESGFPQLSTGDDYILFLNRAWRGERRPSSIWRLAWGPFTTIAIDDHDRLRPLSQAGAVSRAADGQSLAQFTEQIRSSR